MKKLWEEKDWIRDVKIVDDGEFIVLLTSHNRVIIHKISSRDVGNEAMEIQSDEQCILYVKLYDFIHVFYFLYNNYF